MIETSETGAMIITGEHVALYRLMTLRSGLRLEIQGLRMSRGRTCYAIVKSELGFKGNKARVLTQLDAHIETWKEAHA